MKKTNKQGLALNRLTITRLKAANGGAPSAGYWWNNDRSYDNYCSNSCNSCVDGQCGSWDSGQACSMDCQDY